MQLSNDTLPLLYKRLLMPFLRNSIYEAFSHSHFLKNRTTNAYCGSLRIWLKVHFSANCIFTIRFVAYKLIRNLQYTDQQSTVTDNETAIPLSETKFLLQIGQFLQEP
ncbi:hypothetical protein BJ925_1290 [Rahnella aquatilis]|nr:hypothetical protein BJ925_1290 [Rahnella aquatilis]